RGTDVILYIDDENKEYLEQARIDTLLKKYCRFLPVPVISGKEQEWKDGKYVDTDRDKVVNATEPLWTKKPSELTDADYLRFYHELMPGMEDPMFWIHLNVDYPFTLTGILYFPKVKSNIDLQRNRIQLYCNQVYVTDQVEGVVPEFMTLMQGVIDSPDIPLNVSRSYLQADTQVKKISSYITKKVAEKLAKMLADDRKAFEEKWDDIEVFIAYGMLTDEKFFEAARKFFLFKDTQNNYYTLEQYRQLVEPTQTDKEGNVVYIYTTDPAAQHSYIKAAEDKGYNVLVMTGQLDSHLVGLLESKLEKTRFVRVDADIPERLIAKEDQKGTGLSDLQSEIMTTVFTSQLPASDNANFLVAFQALGTSAAPATVTQNEFMRRMKEMAAMQPGGGFYSQLPDSYELVVNTEQPAVRKIIDEASAALDAQVAPLHDQIEAVNKEIADARKDNQSADTADLEKKVADLRNDEQRIVSDYAAKQPVVKQIIDLALLQSNLLKGQALTDFIKRSVELL
ncbi:MAG: molecular chaperone HtpG, partial [Muribaculaceae bacterium]|nr:molecular chaperone HtpG [Muribaculaceae bacterium]